MIALIDADIVPYEIGSALEDASINYVQVAVDNLILKICKAVGAVKYECYLTLSEHNFRLASATVVPYKGHRKAEKPKHWEAIRDYLISDHAATSIAGYEADDVLAMRQEGDTTVICSRDKDLRMVEGYHYSWKCGEYQPEKPLYWISYDEGIRWFYTQLVMGDATDNIPGCIGYGIKKAEAYLEEATTEEEMLQAAQRAYEDCYGEAYKEGVLTYRKKTYTIEKSPYDLLLEMADLLWMVREQGVIGSDYIRGKEKEE
jgi:hypothetical protein